MKIQKMCDMVPFLISCHIHVYLSHTDTHIRPYLVNHSEILVQVTTVFSTFDALQDTLESFRNWSKSGGGHSFMAL